MMVENYFYLPVKTNVRTYENLNTGIGDDYTKIYVLDYHYLDKIKQSNTLVLMQYICSKNNKDKLFFKE